MDDRVVDLLEIVLGLFMLIMISLEIVKLESFIFYEKESLHSIRDEMKRWHDDNLVLAVAAVLDPRFKLDVVKHWYKKIYGGESENI
ncbi:hypothetical protein QYF36_011414 [Acer negundo]|nr:hypothetical protein QYF36_011414 [Acer negundo]